MRRIKRGSKCILCLLLILVCLAVGGLQTGAEAQVIYRCVSKTGRPCIALTFDDGPHPKYTPMILDILKEAGVPATFFAIGINVELYPELVKRIVNEGHELGNHTYNHNHAGKMSSENLKADIAQCNDAIEKITGQKPRYLRPPEGVCNQKLREICGEEDMTIMMWCVDTRDWAHTPVAEICQNVRRNTKTGSIILMHDFIGKNSPTPEALRQIIPILRGLGYEFVTIGQLLAEGGAA